jgi:tetratricopeptide (TPR) repeat protein
MIYQQLPRDSVVGQEATLANLGALAAERDELPRADSLTRQALALRQARLGAQHPLTARTMTTLASIRLRRGQLEEAERLVAEALDLQQRTLPSPHRDLAASLALQAAVLMRRNRLADAEAAQREALAMSRALYGDAHLSVARALADLGNIVRVRGRLEEAAQLQHQAADRYRESDGERSVSTAIALTNLAYTEFLRRRLEESETIYRRALPVLDSIWQGTPRIATLLTDFATVLAQRGNCGEAEAPARRSLELARSRWPDNNVDVIRPQRLLGQCLVVLREFDDAEPLLLDAHQKLLEGWGAASSFTRGAAQDLVQLYQRWGKPQQADRFR